jgi:cell division protein FtsL
MQSAQRKYDYEVTQYPAKKRVVKMQGNVAYISIDPERPATKTRPATRPAQKTQSQQQKSKAEAAAKARAQAQRRERVRSRKSLASTLFVVFVAFCALSLMVSRYSAICTIGAQNNEIKESIGALDEQIDELSLKIELGDNVEEVQKKAEEELEMAYPRQDQKISINMSG